MTKGKHRFIVDVEVTFSDGHTDYYNGLTANSFKTARQVAAYNLKDARITARENNLRITSYKILFEEN